MRGTQQGRSKYHNLNSARHQKIDKGPIGDHLLLHPPTYCRDPRRQNAIGWLQALTGLISNSWEKTQQLHLRYLREKKRGVKWIEYLIKK